MAQLDVRVPQMGEGLQEVVIVGFHKKPGDTVKRDELLYSMETDKAVMDVESPYDGVLTEWLAAEGAVLPIGAAIAHLESATGSLETASASTEAAPNSAPKHTAAATRSIPFAVESARHSLPTGIVIPPRTRARCKQLEICDDEMLSIIPATGSKLMPADVDAYAAARSSASGHPQNWGQGGLPPAQHQQSAQPAEENTVVHPHNWEQGRPSPIQETVLPSTSNYSFTETPLPAQQRVFTSRIRRSAALVIPATMTRPVMWEPVCSCTRAQREQDFTFRPTDFQTFAWCVAQASRNHPKLRSTLLGDETVREYSHLNLGIAVGLKSGELVTAVVHEADTLDYHDFVQEAQSAIALARAGKDQADAATQLHLTYMGSYGITEATPLLVAPAIAVIFVGATYPREGNNWVNLSLTIDHRLINGVEGAKFLNTVVEIIGKLDELA